MSERNVIIVTYPRCRSSQLSVVLALFCTNNTVFYLY